jgi:Polyketide cyclase / dehydrase and lipid transport
VTAGRERLTGHITVALPPEQAYLLFTPRGEQDWAHGWHPHFPAPAPDDAEPGTVFETRAHGQHTIWVVTSRERGRRICYARVTPGDLAGTVTVAVTPSGGHSDVEVIYQLTALTAAAEGRLREFAAGYPAYLRSWQDAISSRHVAGREVQHPGRVEPGGQPLPR